jgi:hypothetical protein
VNPQHKIIGNIFAVQIFQNYTWLENVHVQSWHLFDVRQFFQSQFLLPECLEHIIEQVKRVA